MVGDFSLEKAKDATQSVKRDSKVLCPWLPDPPTCECGRYMDAESEYVAEQAMIVDVWTCPECEYREYRDGV